MIILQNSKKKTIKEVPTEATLEWSNGHEVKIIGDYDAVQFIVKIIKQITEMKASGEI